MLRLVFVQSESLQSRVKLLNRWVVIVASVEVNRQILDEELGSILLFLSERVDNSQLASSFLFYLLKASRLNDLVKVSDVVCIGQYDQLETGRGLKTSLLINLLVLRQQGTEANRSVLTHLAANNRDFLLSNHLVDEGVGALARTNHLLLIWEDKHRVLNVVVALEIATRFKAHQGHADPIKLLNRLHLFLRNLDFFAPNRIISPNFLSVKGLTGLFADESLR